MNNRPLRTDQEKHTAAFDDCIRDMTAMYGREFTPAAIRLYYEACQDWSPDKIREAFKRAIQSERYCPTVAVLLAYGGGIHEDARKSADYPWPTYTPEQLAELKAMRARFNSSKPDVPWADDANSTAGMKI